MINLNKDFLSKYDIVLISYIKTVSKINGTLKMYYQAKASGSFSSRTLNKMPQDINQLVQDHNTKARKDVPYAKELIIRLVFFY